ncbi:MAG: outer membrane beta-barrel protein [Bacteroidaceae bacterium]|nr:outer membrane beta-barrel protein [Bacteroidaceae bacterium]
MRVLITIALLLLSLSEVRAQGDVEYRLEVGVSAGGVNYMGDYNSNPLKCWQPSVGAVVRRVINPYMDIRAEFSWGILKGDYIDKNNFYPLTPVEKTGFKNTLYDIKAVYEYNFWPYGTGRDYHRAKRIVPYIFAGLGATIVSTDGKTVFTGNLPIGVGGKFKVADRWNIGLEWGFQFTLSDKLDGIEDPYGIKSSGIFKNCDLYSMLKVSATYSLWPKCSTCNNDR